MSYLIYTVKYKAYVRFKNNRAGKNSTEAKEKRLGLHF